MSANCTEGTHEDWFKVWKVVKVTTLALSAIPLLITVSMTFYLATKVRKRQYGNIGGRYALVIDSVCFVFALLSFLRVGLDLEMILGNDSDWGCIASMRAKNLFYMTAILFMYVILWLRQKVFYDNPALKTLRSITVRVCSWLLSFFIVAAYSAAVVLYLVTTTHVTTNCGCKRKESTRARVAVYGANLVCVVLYQVVLLALLVYPLVRHRINQSNVVRRFLKRACIAAAVCILTDITSSIMALTLGKYEAYNLVFEINLVVNLVTVVSSFPDWRKRFVACDVVRHWLKIRELKGNGDGDSSTRNTAEATRLNTQNANIHVTIS